VGRRTNLALLMALRRVAGDREAFERLTALVTLLLWAELAAAGGRNPDRPVWMRTSAPARERGWHRRARSSIGGRRARG
jgi:hypothetical protein